MTATEDEARDCLGDPWIGGEANPHPRAVTNSKLAHSPYDLLQRLRDLAA